MAALSQIQFTDALTKTCYIGGKKMFSYAYIVNSKSMTPEDYHWEYANDAMEFRFFATCSMEMTKQYARRLVADGFECIDLCGDFDKAKANEIWDAAYNWLKVFYAKYSDEEETKFANLSSRSEFGLIVMVKGLAEEAIQTERVTGPDFNTTIALVGSEQAALTAAQQLVANGVNFIELCSYFDAYRAAKIIEGIQGQAPVGYCG